MRKSRTTRRVAALATGTALTALLTAAPAGAGTSALPVVTASGETAALHDDEPGGNSDADDPAIWRNPADPGRSLVVATAKEGGLRVYDLDARTVQSLPAPKPPSEDDAPGRYNNVDLVTGLRTTAGRADVAVVSDRGNDRLRVYRIDPARPGGPLTDITDPAAAPVFSADQAEINDQRTAYGLATWTDRATGRSYALVSRRERTRLALLELVPAAHGTVGYRRVRTLDLPSSFRLPDGTTWRPCAEPGELPQVEGMVVDPATGTLYAGQEDIGIWRLRADLTGRPVLVDKVKEYGVPGTYDEETEECVPGTDPGYGGKRLSADVEGLTLLQERDGDGHLLASSQGDDTFALYDREVSEGNAYEGGFRIGAATPTLDGVQECDGAAILDAPLGSRYPRGLLVVQDGEDTPAVPDGDGGTRTATGFKFVDLGDLRDAADL
ncbi:phytase [Streptomyces heilongjiangensis]|uniref:Phytase n=1 Tax=Streptomyces heilongjiangensis TaxID=945052 RepID=A0ABW1B7K8_9ACTN|nr:phytase [Streptomyces heilongjiangensis]MDC2950103.1 phytase [Streptomyces heilongjiangensis]